MKRVIVSVLAVLALLTGGTVVLAAAHEGEEPAPPVTARMVAFCYGFDEKGAQDWVDWLAGEGFMAFKFKAEDSDSTDLKGAGLIIIASDTGSNWSDSADVYGIIHSGKPVLAMGSGGAKYLWNAVAGTGGNYNVYSNIVGVHAANFSHPIYKVPNDMPYEDVYVYDFQRSGADYKIADLPGNVTILGNDLSDTAWSLITFEDSGTHRYTTWGFNTATPDNLNADGKLLCENVVWFALGGYPVPEYGSAALVPVGMLGILAATLIVRRKKS